MKEPDAGGAHPDLWMQVSEHALVIAAHDHLQRGIRRREWREDRLPAPQADEPSGGG
jgi:hypothetical protein